MAEMMGLDKFRGATNEEMREAIGLAAEMLLPIPESAGDPEADEAVAKEMFETGAKLASGSFFSAEILKALEEKLYGGPDAERNKRFIRAAEQAKSEAEIEQLAKKMGIDNDEAVAFAKSNRRGVIYREGVPPVGQVDERLPDLPADRIENLDVIEGEAERRASFLKDADEVGEIPLIEETPEGKAKPRKAPESRGGSAGIFSSGKSVDDYVAARDGKGKAPLTEFAQGAEDSEILDENVSKVLKEDAPKPKTSKVKKAAQAAENLSDDRFYKMGKFMGKHWRKGIIPAGILSLLYLMKDNEGEGDEIKDDERPIFEDQPKPEATATPAPQRRQAPQRQLPRRAQRQDKARQRLEEIYRRADEMSRRLNRARGR